MKKITLLLLLLTLPVMGQWKQETIDHGTQRREYRLYVPENYQAATPASLVIALHGMGSTTEAFIQQIKIDRLADQENYIVVCPQGLPDEVPSFGNLSTWNSGAGIKFGDIEVFPGQNVDDVGFISALIDSVSNAYNINAENVFAFGFSMGGFMTQRLALELNDKIRVFASVAGTMGNGIVPVPSGKPGRPVSIAHFHGTEDLLVLYENNLFGNDVEEMIAFWKENNQAASEPRHTLLPNIANDGLTVEHYQFSSTANNSVVELFKVNNGAHIWLNKGRNDISYTEEILKFFKKVTVLSQTTFRLPQLALNVFSNPVTGDVLQLAISGDSQAENDVHEINVYDLAGRSVLHQECRFRDGSYTLTKANRFGSGVYLIETIHKNSGLKGHRKIVVH